MVATKKKTETVETELDSLQRKHHGLLRPEDVVAYAVDPTTALHSRFEWDDAKAGHAHRVWQARRLIVSVVYKDADASSPTSAYVSLRSDRGRPSGGYRMMGTVLSNSELTEQMLEDALADLMIFKHKYERLGALAPVFRAFDVVLRKRSVRKKAG